jgi:hypothetical protein
MPKKDSIHPWQQIEEQAFHAFREWHIWLHLRERELAARSAQPPSGAVSAAAARPAVEQPAGN